VQISGFVGEYSHLFQMLLKLTDVVLFFLPHEVPISNLLISQIYIELELLQLSVLLIYEVFGLLIIVHEVVIDSVVLLEILRRPS